MGDRTNDPGRNSLRLLPSGPDRVGEGPVRRRPPTALYQVRAAARQVSCCRRNGHSRVARTGSENLARRGNRTPADSCRAGSQADHVAIASPGDPMAALLHHLAKLDIPGGGQVVAEGTMPMSAICGRRTAPRSSMSPTRAGRESCRRSRCRRTPTRTRCGCTATSCWSTTSCSAHHRRAAGRFRGRHQDLRHHRQDQAAPDRALQIAAARTASIRTGATPTSRPRKTAMSATSS